MRTLVVASLAGLAALALAGCSGSSTAGDIPVPAHPLAGFANVTITPDGAFSVPLSADGCDEGMLIVRITPDHAQSFLPEGFVAADLQALLGTPAPTGFGGAWLNAYTCDGTFGVAQGAEFGILVQAPTVANGTVLPADLHIYQLAQATQSPAFAAALDLVGFPRVAANVSIASSLPGALPLSTTSYTVSSANASHAFETVVASTQTLTTSANFYHLLPASGLAYSHFELDAIAVRQGTVSACTLSGLSAELAGIDSCRPGDALAMVAPQQAWTAAFHYLPSATVVAAV